MNKENKSPIINFIARKTNKPFDKDLSHLILAILCENRKSIGVFKNMLVSDIRNQIVNTKVLQYSNPLRFDLTEYLSFL